MDSEKVIKEWEAVLSRDPLDVPWDLIDETLALLKEQEAVEPKTEPSAKGFWFTCGVCGWWLFEVRDTVHFDDRKRIHFCASCGRSVKWE